MHKPVSILKSETYKILLGFWERSDHFIPAKRLDLVIINKKKKNGRIVDLAVPADSKEKIKESKKINTYLDLVGEIRKL